jgi:site-specific recombinase XerD
MRRWDGLADRYLEAYAARGVTAATVRATRRELDRWGAWLKRRRPRPNLEAVDVDLHVRYLRGRTAFRSKATVRGVMTVMRGMGEFLVRERVWASNPLRWMEGPKVDSRSRSPRRIGTEPMKQLWAAAGGRGGYHRWLWLAVLGLLYGTGLRRGELVRLNVGDWDRDEAVLRVDGRKTGRPRQAVVPEVTYRCLEAYLPQRQNHLERLGAGRTEALLVNRAGERLNDASVSGAVKRLAGRAGLRPVTLHQFRHTCASDLLESGAHVAEVQQVLGHETIATTVRYLHIADPARHEAAARHPINRMLSEGGTA